MKLASRRGQRPVDAALVRRFRSRLLGWYALHGRVFGWRRNEALSDYEIVVTESLLQRTRAETVSRFIDSFLREFPSWPELAAAPLPRLEAYLKPIGLWRRRADTLLRLATAVRDRGSLPASREELEALPGIGQYIANAVMLLRDKRAEPLLDVNMARVLERFFGPRHMADIRYDPYLQSLARRVVRAKKSHLVNWAILDLAAAVCIPGVPRCKSCPLSADCLSAFKIETRQAPRSFRVRAAKAPGVAQSTRVAPGARRRLARGDQGQGGTGSRRR